tara:strand:- start:171 stop:1316 length:1146 start_codon:yes stop_codon:yes gene_type:complete
MCEQKIIELIKQGESSALEFKEQEVRAESIAKEVCSFSNSGGGTILVGITDRGEIKGINDSKNWEEWIANISRENIIPPVSLDSKIIVEDSKKILVIQIHKGRDKPYQTSDNKFLIRVGSTNRVASPGELIRLFQEAGLVHFDANPLQGTNRKNLDTNLLANYFSRYSIDIEDLNDVEKDTILKNTEILSDEGSCTVAGLLCFGISSLKYLPQAEIKFAHFTETQVTGELIDRQNIQRDLSGCIDQTIAIIKNNIREESKIKGALRKVTKAGYTDKVFRELITNAMVHRDWSKLAPVRILIFSDRIEFISPGRLPNSVSIEKLKYGVSHPRNPIILKFLENMGYVDRLGRGLPMVYQESQKLKKSVKFEEVGEEFRVILEL